LFELTKRLTKETMQTNHLAHMTYVSLLVRMWRDEGESRPDQTSEWHSEVEHIQSGHMWQFDSLNDLIGFVNSLAHNPTVLTNPKDE
jgi:hypothetical protein